MQQLNQMNVESDFEGKVTSRKTVLTELRPIEMSPGVLDLDPASVDATIDSLLSDRLEICLRLGLLKDALQRHKSEVAKTTNRATR